jgi:hypothetical protein
MHAHARDAARRRAGDRDVDEALVPAHEAPVGAGREEAERRVVPAREHGRDEPTRERDRCVSDGVDTAVHAVQPPGSDAMGHGVAVEAALAKLAR